MMRRGQVAVVTGGAHRLGASIVLALARAGCDVVVNYRSSAGGAAATVAAAQATGVRALAVPGDMSSAADVDRLLNETVAAYGRVDVLVANAGVFLRTPIEALTEADWDAMLDGNLRTAFLCAHRFGLHMRRHAGGAIVTIADVAAQRPWADYLPYSVAKAGVVALTLGLAKALAPGVRVNAIAPGPVLLPDDFDPAHRQREIDRTLLRRQGRADNVADAVVALVANDYITGVVLPVDGGRSIVST